MEHAGEQRAGLGDEEAAGLEQQAAVEACERAADRGSVFADFGRGIRRLLAVVVDAEAAAGVDGADVDAVAAELADQLADALDAPRRTASAERICEPMWTLTPCGSSQRLPCRAR